MKNATLAFTLLFILFACGACSAQEAITPEIFQAKALTWIAVAIAVFTAVVTGGVSLALFVIGKVKEVRKAVEDAKADTAARLDRQHERLEGQQAQIAAVSLATPANGPLVPPGGQSGPTGLVGLAIACFLALFLMGCATDTGDAGKDARGRATNQALQEAGKVLGQVAVQTLFNVASQEASGKGVDFQQAAASGLWANIDAAKTGASISRIVDAYSGNKMTQTALAAKQAFDAVQGDETNAAAINAIAAVISSAAGAPPALK